MVDELNSYLGVVMAGLTEESRRTVEEVQRNLLIIGSILAGAKKSFPKSKTTFLEKEIDQMAAILPPLKNFILPGGSLVGAQLHFARSLARRAEREVVALGESEKINPLIIVYLNRLSDFLFMLARKQNFQKGVKETIWVGGKK